MEALPIEARAKAARDRNRLASLVARGVARLHGPVKPEHQEFVDDIERRARAQRPAPAKHVGMDTIRPNQKKQKKRKRR